MKFLQILGVLCCLFESALGSIGAEPRVGFLAIRKFDGWASRSDAPGGQGRIWTSPWVEAGHGFDEMVLSWNVKDAWSRSGFQFQVQIMVSNQPSAWFHLGKWSLNTNVFPRHSVTGTRNSAGHVDTDTLKLVSPSQRYRLQLLVEPAAGLELASDPPFRSLGVATLNSRTPDIPRPEFREAWGMRLVVPELSQHAYQGGHVWCSPSSLAMLLAYWGDTLDRNDLRINIPEAARSVFDPVYGGTGNWSFNTAFAGSFPGLEAYVIRLRDLADLESLVWRRLPVAVSVSLGLLRGRGKERDDGHLVVLRGFDQQGNPWVNDPDATHPPTSIKPVLRLYQRDHLLKAWATSQRTVYVLAPATQPVEGLLGMNSPVSP